MKREIITCTVLSLPEGIFSGHRYPCEQCGKEIDSSTHDIRYVGHNTTKVTCAGTKKSKLYR